MKKLLLISLFVLAACTSTESKDITLLDSSLSSILSADATIEYLTGKDYVVSEGPVWSVKDNGLLFTDVDKNKMFLWQEGKGVSIYMDPSGYTGYAPTFENGENGANGVMLYNGQLVLCQHGDRRLAYVAGIEGTSPVFRTLVDSYEGKRFNSPNDLVASRMGDIYFTDPPYGLYNKEAQRFDEDLYRELSFQGVYCYSASGKLTLITKEMTRPNGIALSLDESYLYVNNSDADNPVMMRYEVNNDWTGEVFFDGTQWSNKYEGGFDGMKVHSSGNIFTTAPNGLFVLSPTGELLGTINFGGAVTNCAFGPEEKYLYVTTFGRVARIKLQP